MRSSGGALTSGTNDAVVSATDDNTPEGTSQEDETPPEPEQPAEVTDPMQQAPPESQDTPPSAASTPSGARRENNSEATEVAGSPTASTKTGATSLLPRLSGDTAAARLFTAAATDGQAADQASQTPASTFTTLQAPTSVAPQPTNTLMAAVQTSISRATSLVAAVLQPFLGTGPAAPPESPLLWAVLGWVRRQSNQARGDQSPIPNLVQTSQTEPVNTAEVSPAEEVSALAEAAAQVDADAAAAATGLPAEFERTAQALGDQSPIPNLVQTSQTEPVNTAEVSPAEEVSALAEAAAQVDAAVAAAATGLPAEFDVTPQETTLVVDTVSEPLALAAAAAVPGAPEVAAAAAPGATIFFESSPRIGEANGTVMVPIVRAGDLTGVSTIEYGITPDTATAGVDYLGGNGTITMDVGEDRVFIPVQILNDNLSEPTETFVVSIINVEGATLLFPRTARIDILDDENPVVDPPSPPLTSNYIVTEQVVVSGSLNQPLAFEFAPQDPSLIYVAEKGGVIKVFDVDTGAQQSTFIDISAKVNNAQDRGLLDIALHPNFGQPVQPGQPEHNYVYAFYVVDPPGTAGNPDPDAQPDGGGNRFAYLVRFTADAATDYTTAVPGSEVILLGGVAVPGVAELQPRTLQDISGAGAVDSTSDFSQPESGFNADTGEYVDNYIKVDARSHAGGSLAFGPDGALYVSIGDGTSFNATDPRTVSVQNINSLSGKILRIDPLTGLGLPDNPFVEPGDDLSANHSKVYQLGLRNPFSMGFAQDGRLFITNTGWDSWEEIESGHAGANFGWPYFEGGDNGVLLPAPGYQNLPSDPARNLPSAAEFYTAVENGTITITPAYRAFAHNESTPGFQVGAIVGFDAPYSGSRYPAEFQNDVFFTDINDGEVFVVDVNDRSDVKFLYSTESFPVSFSQGPDGYAYVANMSGNITRLLIEPIPDPPPPPPPPNITLAPHGSASVADDVYTLTTAAGQAGTAMSTGRIDVRQNFTVAFEVESRHQRRRRRRGGHRVP